MKIIILTVDLQEGMKLKDALASLNPEFVSIGNFTKEHILSNPIEFIETTFIFSTWYMPTFTESEIKECFPSLRAIFYAAGTVKYFAMPFLNLGVRVFSDSKANAIPVAEFVSAQVLLANKGYFQAQKEYKKPFWRISFNNARNYTIQRKGNYDAKIGIIGCGAIGSKVISFLEPYNLDITVYDPLVSNRQINELKVKRGDLIDIFSNSDVISNHLPDTAQTKGIINGQLLSLMKDNATFINTGRGAQVVEKDLVRAMRRKPNACALLDVTLREPIRPWSGLLRLKNVFITPHIAGSLSSENFRMVEYMLTAYSNTVNGYSDMCEISVDLLNNQA